MDPMRDHQRIVHLLACYEFPWDITRSLELALFRTFCVPRISKLLDATGEFRLRAQKRYDDTDLLVSELLEHGYGSERGRRALARMNHLHGRFNIHNDDYLYVLSTFVYEPIRWNEQFGWRRMCTVERLAFFYFWTEVGRRMGIQAIPQDYEAFEQFNIEVERTRFSCSEANYRTGRATLDMFASWFPPPLRPIARHAMYTIMGPRVRAGFAFPAPARLVSTCTLAVLRLRALALRLLPARRKPRMRTQLPNRSYPNGYKIDNLGPADALHAHSPIQR